MKRIYYVVETEFGDSESEECNTIEKAKAELKRIQEYYKKEFGGEVYKLVITKYEEE